MRSLRYLNTILTVLAVLLTVQVWTLWNAPGSLDRASEARPEGIPDAGAQRQAIIDQLKLVNVKLADMASLLRSGELKVKVDGAQKVVDVAPAVAEPPTPSTPTAHPTPPVNVPQVMLEK